MEDKIYNTSVLIIGAGPVGLALALELGLRGIQCLIVEQRDGKVTLPKMNTVNTRTMEFCRRWGVATKIKQAGIGEDYPLDIRFITSMAGYELLRFRYPTYRERGKLDYTPEGNCVCSQLWFDPILLERVAVVSQHRGAPAHPLGIVLANRAKRDCGVARCWNPISGKPCARRT